MNFYRKKTNGNNRDASDNSASENGYLYALALTLIFLLVMASTNSQQNSDVPSSTKAARAAQTADNKLSRLGASKSDNQRLALPILIGSYSEKELTQLKQQQASFWLKYQESESSERAQLLVAFVNKIVNRKNTKTRYDQALFASLQADENGIHHLGSQKKKLNRLYKKYQVSSADERRKQLEIERKMDIVPAALVSAVALVQTKQIELAELMKSNNLFARYCEQESCYWLNNRQARQQNASSYLLLEDSITQFYDALNREAQFKAVREQRRDVKSNKQRLFALNLADDFEGVKDFVKSPSKQIKQQLKQYRLE